MPVKDLLSLLFLLIAQSSILIIACMHQGSIYYRTKWLSITKNLKLREILYDKEILPHYQ